MANIKSQIKRNRQNTVRAARNKGVRTELKTRVKKAASAAGTSEAGDLYQAAQKRIDMAAAKGIIPKRAAARRKSRLARRIGSLS